MAVRIAVTVKQVPDVNATPRLTSDGTVDRDGELVLDPGDECGVEVALQIVETHGGEVVLVSMGPERATAAVRAGLSMGADRGILVVDPALAGGDAFQTGRVLAAVIERESPDLVICGTESSDGSTGLVPPMLAELLGVPQLTFATTVEVGANTVTIRRQTDDGHEVLEAPMPALVTVTAAVAEPRYPTLKTKMAAKSKPVARMSLQDLGIVRGPSVETIERIVDAPTRSPGEVVDHDGVSGVEKILDLLAAAQVI